MLKVEKTDRFMLDLDDVVIFIAKDNVDAAMALEDRIHQQVDSLADSNFPRRKGRKAGTLELACWSWWRTPITSWCLSKPTPP